MATVSNIAQTILDENGYAIEDFENLTLTILENKIDDAIDYINAQAGLTIAALTGEAESKTLTYTAPQNVAVKQLINLELRAYKEKGVQVGIAGMSVTYLLSDPDFKLSMQLLDKIIGRLKSPPIYVSEDIVL
ncbi:MAG: hypothetical protein OEZ40_01620 [Candidatus Bathyarchaeota archaeon]|nr:hypothetical protein [Candidatus Bathyarchaeota archaeon]